MAAQLVTSTGVGELLIKYTASGTEYSIRVVTPTVGVYVNDANTGFKYKVLSGSSSAPTATGITFTQITSSYKKLVWDVSYESGSLNYSGAVPAIGTSTINGAYQITSLIIGANTYTFASPVSLKRDIIISLVTDQIYKLNIPNIIPTSYKYEPSNNTNSGITYTINKSSIIINIEDLTGDVYLKLVNTNNNVEYLVKGVTEASAVPTGYTATTDPCGVTIAT